MYGDLLAIQELERILVLLKRGTCWCEKAIDNPMVKDHSEGCKRAAAYEKENRGLDKMDW